MMLSRLIPLFKGYKPPVLKLQQIVSDAFSQSTFSEKGIKVIVRSPQPAHAGNVLTALNIHG